MDNIYFLFCETTATLTPSQQSEIHEEKFRYKCCFKSFCIFFEAYFISLVFKKKCFTKLITFFYTFFPK